MSQFDPRDHMLNIKGRTPYLPVAPRVVWFRLEHPEWSIVTTAIEINMEKQYAIFMATIMNDEGKIIATAHKMEDVKGFGDFIEKAEKGAIGRALALCGYGTENAPEFDEGDRYADAPQKVRGNAPPIDRNAPRPTTQPAPPRNGQGGQKPQVTPLAEAKRDFFSIAVKDRPDLLNEAGSPNVALTLTYFHHVYQWAYDAPSDASDPTHWRAAIAQIDGYVRANRQQPESAPSDRLLDVPPATNQPSHSTSPYNPENDSRGPAEAPGRRLREDQKPK